jgi:hypothetical protein
MGSDAGFILFLSSAIQPEATPCLEAIQGVALWGTTNIHEESQIDKSPERNSELTV